MSFTDFINLQEMPPLCIVSSRCYLSFSDSIGYSTDMIGSTDNIEKQKINPVYSMLNFFFTEDKIPPILLEFSLDLTLGRITLDFSEAVQGQDIISSGITLTNMNPNLILNSNFLSLKLTSGTVGVEKYSNTVILTIKN